MSTEIDSKFLTEEQLIEKIQRELKDTKLFKYRITILYQARTIPLAIAASLKAKIETAKSPADLAEIINQVQGDPTTITVLAEEEKIIYSEATADKLQNSFFALGASNLAESVEGRITSLELLDTVAYERVAPVGMIQEAIDSAVAQLRRARAEEDKPVIIPVPAAKTVN